MNKVKKWTLGFALSAVLGLGLSATFVHADDNPTAPGTTPPPPRGQGPCAADVQKFCQGVQPGQGRIGQCLKAHLSELSPECKEKGEELKAKVKAGMQKIEEACKDDLDKFCKDVQPGGGRKMQCLKQNKDQLSPSCKDTLSQIHRHRQAAGGAGQPSGGTDQSQGGSNQPQGNDQSSPN